MITIKINVQNISFLQEQWNNKCPPQEVHFLSLSHIIICSLINIAVFKPRLIKNISLLLQVMDSAAQLLLEYNLHSIMHIKKVGDCLSLRKIQLWPLCTVFQRAGMENSEITSFNTTKTGFRPMCPQLTWRHLWWMCQLGIAPHLRITLRMIIMVKKLKEVLKRHIFSLFFSMKFLSQFFTKISLLRSCCMPWNFIWECHFEGWRNFMHVGTKFYS